METGDSDDQQFCGNCGAKSVNKDKFCTICGKLLELKSPSKNINMYQAENTLDYTPTHTEHPIQQQYKMNPVREYNAANLLTGTKEAYVQKFSTLIILFGSFYIVVSIFSFLIVRGIVSAYDLDTVYDDEFDQLLVDLITSILTLLIVSLLQFMPNSFVYRIIDNHETNRVETLNEMVGYCTSKWPSYIPFGLFNLLIIVATITFMVVLFFVNIGLGIISILILPLSMSYILLRIVSSPAYIMIDGMSAGEAVSASWDRMKGRLIYYFAASVLLSIVGGIANSIVQLPLTIVFADSGFVALFILPAFGFVFLGPLKPLLIVSVYYLTKISLGESQSSKIFAELLPVNFDTRNNKSLKDLYK
ncbi:MAG: hypothetical protein HeimC2_43170 [Candidatus Heimdallarchaeota archaeon LC_2]|nr:MAG: hypothetical protein HeimC2_43170 [Candidatus Heimdallarchaeota archaeon LC_2]